MTKEQEAFDRLHPAVQHHIVNTLGWPGLRPTQQAAIDPILDGQSCILLAPTAGGKTEAAAFPLLSRILLEDWRGLTVLYVCPIRALLNNLEPRLSYYCGLVGRRVGIWHGDVNDSVKRQILKDPPDILLTTPESLEGMLISANDQKRELLLDVRIVVIDEMHAFCGDDRGWHVRSILHRLQQLNQQRLQVIGLTATVGNPDVLIDWMVAGRPSVVVGEGHSGTDAEIVIDYVGSLENAATIISRLHVGEKRLVFCDSRAKTEELAAHLRDLGVHTFVSHSSLSVDERRQAEKAFAEEPNCVIVATSTLELGIDVGDLDRVIQIDAPSTVASFLQRMGRTGRRAGSLRNCLFLATEDEGLLIGSAIVRLWREGFVESITPPGKPWHLVAHQAMAMVLQKRGVSRHELGLTLGEMFEELDPSGIEQVIDTMVERSILWSDDSGLIGLGTVGEEEFGRRHFESIVSTFNSPMLLTVMFGQREIGFVDPMTIGNDPDRPANLILAGRYWRVVSTDWRARLVYVEQTENKGKASWLGSSRALRFTLCQTIKKILIDLSVPAELSTRARTRLKHLAESFPVLEMETSTVERIVRNNKAEWIWWSFGGGGANFLLADSAGMEGNVVRSYDNFRISLAQAPQKTSIAPIGTFSGSGNKFIRQLGRQLKFHQCLPDRQLDEVMADRLCDYQGAESISNAVITLVQ